MTADHNAEQRNQSMFQRFIHSEVLGSVLLLACAVAALVWANSPWGDSYQHLLHTKIGVTWGKAAFQLSLHHWINDGLMAIFFFVVGLEIKREVVVGELASFKKAVLPFSAALGGMIAPAVLYSIMNFHGPGAKGWGIPMSTDIAFAIGVLSLFGSRVPISLKVFLTALAIVDDLGAVVVIALFYTEKIAFSGLIVAVILMVAIVVAGRMGVRRTSIYLLLCIGVWAAVFTSGIHTTVAGTLIAMLVPVRATIEPRTFLTRCRQRLDQLQTTTLTQQSMIHDHAQLEALGDIYMAAEDMTPAGIGLEHHLHPVTSFLILPLFALFNAGVLVSIESLQAGPFSVGLGVVAGLVLGKQIGVLGASWLAIRSGRAELPTGVCWIQLWGASCLAGVGFTMSLFISSLAFRDPALDSQAKLGVLTASLLAGIFGFIVLQRVLPRDKDKQESAGPT